MDTFWYTNTMKYYVAIRMNELQLPATAWWISQKKEKRPSERNRHRWVYTIETFTRSKK